MNDDAGALRGARRRPNRPGRRAANYVAELTRELARLARQHGLDALGYLLDMARLEAENATRHGNGRAERVSACSSAHLVQQRRVRMAVGDHAVLLLLGADEVAHVEIDVGRRTASAS